MTSHLPARALAILLLALPLKAQTVRVTGSFVPNMGAPTVAGGVSPIAVAPLAVSPLSAAPSLVPSLAPAALTPTLAVQAAAVQPVAAPASLAALDVVVHAAPARAEGPSGASEKSEAPVKAATPVDGWAKRFNFQPAGQVFDGSVARSEIGATFAVVPKAGNSVRVHLVERSPLAAIKPVPGTEGLTGKVLLETLSSIASRNYRQHEYKEASHFIFSKADHVIINGVSGVVDAYSGIFVPGNSQNGGDYPEPGDQNDDGYSDREGMNIEHTWPQSLFNKALPMRSDVHHLMATFMHPNSVRGHLPFGEVKGAADYENKAGAKRGNGVFEPPDAVKGRVARGLLYFYSRYKDSRMFGRTSEVFWNQQIELMLKWNKQFPPDAFEARRNDLVEQWQGNRNPFIDDYTLADRVGADAFKAKGGGSRGDGGGEGGATVSARRPWDRSLSRR